VTELNLRIELLSQSHDRAAFSSGNDDLDRYLRERAGQDQRRRLSAVFVLHDVTNNSVAGYYTLSACQIESGSLPNELAKRLPRRSLPTTLIGRLATDLRYRGQGLGGLLLVNALIRAAEASKDIGAMAVIVDAKDDQVRGFYERYGFRRFADDPYRLFLPMADAERVAHAAGST
jgi:GNAT superfamily N-acetyltransferase